MRHSTLSSFDAFSAYLSLHDKAYGSRNTVSRCGGLAVAWETYLSLLESLRSVSASVSVPKFSSTEIDCVRCRFAWSIALMSLQITSTFAWVMFASSRMLFMVPWSSDMSPFALVSSWCDREALWLCARKTDKISSSFTSICNAKWSHVVFKHQVTSGYAADWNVRLWQVTGCTGIATSGQHFTV